MQHARDHHKKRSGKVTAIKMEKSDGPDGESMADVFLEGELNRAMGIDNPDWLEEMLP